MSAKRKDVGSSPAPDQKVFCAGFLRLCETFFRKFFKCLQRAPFIFFLFCKKMDVQNLPKAPLLHFSALCDLPETKKKSKENREKNSKKKTIFFNFFLTRVL